MNEFDNWYKKEIVKHLVNAARVDLFGEFVDEYNFDKVVVLSPNEVDEYRDFFIRRAWVEAKNLIKSYTTDIDYEVDDES